MNQPIVPMSQQVVPMNQQISWYPQYPYISNNTYSLPIAVDYDSNKYKFKILGIKFSRKKTTYQDYRFKD